MSDQAQIEPDGQAMLPGMEDGRRGEPALVVAARRSIRSLEAAGFLDERHAILTQLMLDLAWAADAGTRTGRASAAALAGAQILATYQLLVPEAKGGDDDAEWSQLVADIRRSATALRDAT